MTDGPRELRVVVTAADYEAALHFYRDVLGLDEQAAFAGPDGGRACVLHAGRATVEIANPDHARAVDVIESATSTGPVRLAFEVTDAVEAAAQLQAAGATALSSAARTPWGSTNVRLTGPGGQQITLWSTDIYTGPRQRLDSTIHLAEPDPGWAGAGAGLVDAVNAALGTGALTVAHVGSTSVPALAAKPLIDLVLGVDDPTDEDAYVPALTRAGYALHLREPDWHQHRLLRRDDPAVNLHVFAAGAREIDRMVAFRDHLRRDDRDRALYEATKRELAARTWAHTQDYADAKSDVVADIMSRAWPPALPSPLRCFVLLSGPKDLHRSEVARALATGLGLPLLSTQAARTVLGAASAGDADRAPVSDQQLVDLVLALAGDSGGAVLDIDAATADTAAVDALPGKIIWLSVDAGAAAHVDLEWLARRVRQVAAGGGAAVTIAGARPPGSGVGAAD